MPGTQDKFRVGRFSIVVLNFLLTYNIFTDTEIRKLDNASKHSPELESQVQRREAAVEFIFCLALLEILKQLPFHPGHEDLIRRIEHLAFRHFKFREGIQNSPNAHNIHMISDLYAEVIGVLAQSRFQSVSN